MKDDTGDYSFSSLDRTRVNVVDLVSYVGRKAVPAYILNDIDMTFAEGLRNEFREFGYMITVTAILLKAIGIAQRAHPISRQSYLPFGRRVTLNKIVGGITVERRIGSKPSVFFGVVDSPDTKPIHQIALELKAFRDAEVDAVPQFKKERFFSSLPWMVRRIVMFVAMLVPSFRLMVHPATFGISSLGKFGISACFGPCICTSTFGVGLVEPRPVVKDGKVMVRPMMTISLSFDHRVMDFVPAARFMQDLQRLLEGEIEQYIKHPLTNT